VSQGLRVVQWATGNIGSRALRGVIEHPDLELAGVWVHDPAKAGLDAGELCDLGPAGITTTNELDDIVALGADCILHTPRGLDADEVCRLLESGANLVTTCGQFHHPPSMEPGLRDRVEAACDQGATSIHSTGSSPGFISEAVPLLLTSIQRRLSGVLIDEYADLSQRPSPELLFELMGFGGPPAAMGPARTAHLAGSFGPSLRLVADAIGLALDDIEASGEVAVARHDIEIAAGPIAAGTVAAQRVTVSGRRDGRELLRFRANWYCTRDIDTEVDEDWDLRSTGWRVVVDGDAPLDVELRFPVTLDQMAETAPGYTANRAVNAVAAVCAAAPGIRTTLDLPRIVARFGTST
jgi:2,4-diaminopentanoate dehydrogenase